MLTFPVYHVTKDTCNIHNHLGNGGSEGPRGNWKDNSGEKGMLSFMEVLQILVGLSDAAYVDMASQHFIFASVKLLKLAFLFILFYESDLSTI